MELMRLFCLPVAEALNSLVGQTEEGGPVLLQEIRLRAERPLMVRVGGKVYFVSSRGRLLTSSAGAFTVSYEMLAKCLELMSGSSLYAFENEIQNGYLTVEGGHRIGLCGRVRVKGGIISSINPVTGLNVRVAHEIKGCAGPLLPHVTQNGNLLHTLLVSPPGGGKTTMLRDLIRLASDQLGLTVAVADERSELGGSFRGIPQCDIGERTDLLDGCPKSEGMMLLLRAMNPQVIAVDELGSQEDLAAVRSIMHAGVKLLCTVHSSSVDELGKRPGFSELFWQGVFERVVILSSRCGPGTVEGIYEPDRNGEGQKWRKSWSGVNGSALS